MQNQTIRTIDGGGSGFRRADIIDGKVQNFVKIGPISKPEELVEFACADMPPETKGIVYAMAGAIKDKNIVVKSPQIHMLDGFNLGEETRKVSNKPTIVFNDMDGAVIGMSKMFPDLNYFMAITWSSGVGVRIFKENRILNPNSEGGHIPFDPSPSALMCACGMKGCSESILGGEAIKRRVSIRAPKSIHPCRFLDQAFVRKEKWALEEYNLIAEAMASFLATYQSIFRLPAIVWKGRFAQNALPLIGDSIKEKMKKRLSNPEWADEVKFYFSKDSETDSLIGVAMLFNETMN